METEQKIAQINLKANSALLVDYLEAVIVDEMVLNSFIRDLKIIYIDKKSIGISISSEEAINIIKENYLKYFVDGIKNIFEKNLEIKFIFGNQNLTFNSKNKPETKNISKKLTLLNYVVGSFNKEPTKMLQKSLQEPGYFSPIFISSKSGFGKTHLLHAIGNAFNKQNNSVCYIEPNRFTKKIIEKSKISNDSLSKYIEELCAFDVLLFDDIQNLGDRVVTLRVLFQIINNFIELEKQIVITSDKSPQALSGFESRFITRFSSGLTTNIQTPSIDDLIKVIEFKLKKVGLNPSAWEKDALKFIARNNASSIRSIEGAIKRVKYYVGGNSYPKYTYSIVQNMFKDLCVDVSELTPERIINNVADYYKIPKGELTGKSRKAEIMIARHMAIWLVRDILKLPFKEIGIIFGNRDHSTIIASIKKINQNIKINDVVKIAAKRIEEKIKLIF